LKIFSLLSLLLVSHNLSSEYIEDLLVNKIIDGDTVYAEYNGKLHKIRLTEIDAPERDQLMGSESTAYLSNLLADGLIDAELEGKDAYGRDLGRIYDNGKDINRLMVSSGMAWVYDDYVTDKSFYDDQQIAQNKALGVWSNPNPQSPWDWRKNKKNKISIFSTLEKDNTKSPEINAACCKICKKGKACGDSCISKKYVCTKPKGCACDG
jgi:endonuclease YncB( thermonuclease family)